MTLQEYINSIRDKRIAVIGAGVSNLPLIRLLLSCGCDVTVCDNRDFAALGMEALDLINRGAKLKLGEAHLEGLDHDVIFRSPSLLPFESHLQAARAHGSVVTSEMEVFFAICPCKIIAITGSDGKTTTSTIISELLKAAGYTVHLGGNIGHPLLCDTPQMGKDDLCVLELSSFQLHSMNCHPNVSVVTNISPNHLDKHKDYQDYIDSKMSIFLRQDESDRLVLNRDDGMSEYYAAHAKGKISFFSGKNRVENGACCEDGVLYRVHNGVKEKVIRAENIRIRGEHNVLNYLAAFAATDGWVSNTVCKEVAESFGGVEHRLEEVRSIKDVLFINDSIGTSPSRTAAGLRAMKRKPIIIVGGYDKHIAFDGLGDDLCLLAKHVFITGATADKIRTAMEHSKYYAESGVQFTMVEDFKDAVLQAARSAHKGDIVLLSPACAAFDHFKNFMERGTFFKQIVMELKDEDIGD